MKRIQFVQLFLVVCCLAFTAKSGIGQTATPIVSTISATKPNSSALEAPANSTEASTVPKAMSDLMQASREKFLEGYNLIRTGDSEAARDAFDASVNMLLQSDWSVATTAPLDAYFQDLVQQIKEAEARYLFPTSSEEEAVDSAAVDDFENLDLMSVTDDPALRDALIAGLAKNEYDIPITVNDMVVKSLEFWLNRGRKFFADGLIRSGQYRPIIEEVFRQEAIPLDLINLAQVESFFKPQALSKAKAKGIWQFGKDTAVRYGLKVTRDVDERSDPEKSTRAAARYLNDLFGMFKDWNLALAAYNWGEAKVRRLIDSTGLNDFWQLANLNRRLPEETRRHIPLIQASAILARNPGKYGLPTVFDPPLKYASVSISKPIDLRAAAKVLSTSFDELKKLNPSLKGSSTPANYPNFQLKVPADSDPDLHEQLDSLPKARMRVPSEYEGRYKVRRGDTLSAIARRHHITVKELSSANGLSSKAKLKSGTSLRIPSSGESMEDKSSSNDSAVSKNGAGKSSIGKANGSKKGRKVSAKRRATKKSKATKSTLAKKHPRKKASTKQIAAK